jgi:hypothetical protein
MMTIRLRASVPENREVTLTLPADVPPGEHDFEVTVTTAGHEPSVFEVVLPPDDGPKEFPPRPTNPVLAPEHDAFLRMLPDLMKQYPGKYVALRGGAVVAVGDTEVDALTRAYNEHPGALVLVRLVTDRPQPLPRIGSPRIVRPGG